MLHAEGCGARRRHAISLPQGRSPASSRNRGRPMAERVHRWLLCTWSRGVGSSRWLTVVEEERGSAQLPARARSEVYMQTLYTCLAPYYTRAGTLAIPALDLRKPVPSSPSWAGERDPHASDRDDPRGYAEFSCCSSDRQRGREAPELREEVPAGAVELDVAHMHLTVSACRERVSSNHHGTVAPVPRHGGHARDRAAVRREPLRRERGCTAALLDEFAGAAESEPQR
jgi:hypothetical protein